MNPDLTIDYWKGLFGEAADLKSVPLESYNFYHDCILRHIGKNRTAVIDEKKWSYEAIHERVSEQLPHWRSLGIEAGQRGSFVMNPGIDSVIAFMTALRMGVAVDLYFTTDSTRRTVRTITKVRPNWVMTEVPLEDLETTIFPWHPSIEGEREENAPSHLFLPGQEVCPGLDANEAFLCPLRDGPRVFSLEKGTTWARPLPVYRQEEVFAILATFLAGATLYYTSEEALLENPTLLKKESIDVLGVSERLLNLWKDRDGAPKVKLWHHSAFLGNLADWETFQKNNHLTKTPRVQHVIEPGRGGVVLASKQEPHQSFCPLHPSPGIPWKLLDLNGTDEEAWEGVGFFSLKPSLILGETPQGYVISHVTEPIKGGEIYPVEEVEALIRPMEGIHECMVVADRTPTDLIASKITLLVFTSKNTLENVLKETLEIKMGSSYVPDRILFFPLYPRMKNGKLHRNWVLGQYQMGLLPKKKKSPLHNKLYKLHETLESEASS